MSTRLRPIVMISDTIRAGGHARKLLEDTAQILRVTVPPRGSMPEADRLVEIFQSLPELSGRHFLWLFREPKHANRDRSRYMQLCEYYGLAPSKGKKKKVSPTFDLDAVVMQRLRRREEQQQQTAQVWRQTANAILNPPGVNTFVQQYQAAMQQPTSQPTPTRTFSLDWGSVAPFVPEEEP